MRFPRKILISVAALGVAVSGTLIGTFVLNDANVIKLGQDELREYEAKFYSEGSLLYETGKIKKGTVIGYDNKPTKRRSVDGKVYQFIGWDLSGEGIPDILPNRIYGNFDANACFMRLPTIEKMLMDPDMIAQLAKLLQDLNVELTPEQIQAILDWLMSLGIDWESIDLSVLEQLLDLLEIDLEDFMNMTGLDLEAIMAILARPMFRYNATGAGAYYFRSQSFGNTYSDNAWAKSDYYASSRISSGSVNPLAYAADKLKQYMDPTHFEMKYFNQGEVYPVPVNEINNTQNLDSDSYSLVNPTTTTPDEGYKFGATYSADGFTFVPACQNIAIIASTMYFSSPEITKDEIAYREYVKDHYLQVDDKYRSVFSNIAAERGITKDDAYSYLTQILQYFSENFTFNFEVQAFPKGEDKILYFMEHKEGIGTHFADATTMFFRTIGVPARCVNGYVDYCEIAGEERTVSALQNHYWTEIYLDGIGWLSFDPALASGVLPDEYSAYLFNSFLSPEAETTNDVITDIKIDLPKETYYQGDPFSLDDVKFTVTYEDGRVEEVPYSELTYVTSVSTNSVGEQTLVAIAVSGTTVVREEVKIDVLPVVPVSLDIMENSLQRKYFVNDTFVDGGVMGIITYNNGTTGYVYSSQLSRSGGDTSVVGDHEVTYTLAGYSDIFDSVTYRVISEPDTPPWYIDNCKNYFEVNPGTDPDTLIPKLNLHVVYEDGLSRYVTTSTDNVTLIGDTDLSSSGNHIITVSYTEGDKTITTTITVKVKNRTTLYLVNTKSNYEPWIYDSESGSYTEKDYDGTGFDISPEQIMIDPAYNDEGLSLEVVVTKPEDWGGKAGSFDAAYKVSVLDPSGKNITSEYLANSADKLHIHYNGVELKSGETYFVNPSNKSFFYFKENYTINKLPITLQSQDIVVNSQSDVVNQAKTLYMMIGNTVNGDQIVYDDLVFNGIATPGVQTENTVLLSSIHIINPNGEDVTDSYSITFVPGTITYSEG